MGKFCFNCGNELEEGKCFCGICGVNVEKKKNKGNKKNIIICCISVILIFSIALVAVFVNQDLNKITIAFDSCGGSACSEIKVNKNDDVNLPIPTKKDCYFDGWYTNKNGEGKYVSSSYFVENEVREIELFASWYEYVEISVKSATYSNFINAMNYSPTLATIRSYSIDVKVNTMPYTTDLNVKVSLSVPEVTLNTGKKLPYTKIKELTFNLVGYTTLTFNSIGFKTVTVPNTYLSKLYGSNKITNIRGTISYLTKQIN